MASGSFHAIMKTTLRSDKCLVANVEDELRHCEVNKFSPPLAERTAFYAVRTQALNHKQIEIEKYTVI